MDVLDSFLAAWAADSPERTGIARTVSAIAAAGAGISALIARGGEDHSVRGRNADGDLQKGADLQADDILRRHLLAAPVRLYASEENSGVTEISPQGVLAVAADPLDGSSNVGVNVPVGTIFSILAAGESATGEGPFLRPGREVLAGGYLVYGPRTFLVFSTGDGVHLFVLVPDGEGGRFVSARRNLKLPAGYPEFAVNASNRRHWTGEMVRYIDACLAGSEGPLGEDFNMRWVGSLVADAHRILLRGGIFLYPGDRRGKYREGRLRLVYEAIPVAFLFGQAGGQAISGDRPVLDIVPTALHQRIPLVFGSPENIRMFRTLAG